MSYVKAISSLEFLTNIPIYLNRYIGPIAFILGNIGNLLCFRIFLIKTWRKNICIFYFLICLILNTIYIYTVLVRTVFVTGFKINVLTRNTILCKSSYYLAYLSIVYFPILCILSSIDRLLISSQNIDTRLYSSKRLAYLLISTSFIIISVFSLHVFIRVSIQETSSIVFICYYDQSLFYRKFILYSNLILSLGSQLIIFIISFFSFRNVRRIRAIRQKKRDRIRSMNKKDFQLLRCLYAHNILYLFSILANIVSLIYGLIYSIDTRTTIQQIIFNFFFDFGAFIHSVFRCSSFFIFISLSKAFRQEIKRLGYRICNQNVNPIQDE